MEDIVAYDSAGASFNAQRYDGVLTPISGKYATLKEIIEGMKRFKTGPDDIWVIGGVRSAGRMILIIRNPKDQAVSWYHLLRSLNGIEYDGTFAGFLPSYIEGQAGQGFSWFQVSKEWWTGYKDNPRCHFVFYEEMKADPLKNIKQIAAFLKLNPNDDLCKEIASKTTFENMAKAKQRGHKDQAHLKGDASFYRRGEVGSWREMFTVAQSEAFDSIYNKEMADVPDLKTRVQFTYKM